MTIPIDFNGNLDIGNAGFSKFQILNPKSPNLKF